MKMIVKEAVNILKSRNCRHEDKETAYTNLVSNLKTHAMWEEELKTQQTELMKLLYRDILDTDEKIIINALQIVIVCHGQEHIESFEKSNSELGLKSLIQCGHKTSSVEVIKCILDCLSVQKFHTDVLSNEISVLLTFIEDMNSKVKAQSTYVVEKIVKIFVRLEKQIGKLLRPSSPRWARLVFPGLVNLSHDVREDSLALLEKFREDLRNVQDLSKIIIKALNSGLSKSLKALMTSHESYVLRTWPLIVQVAGKELHKGSTINSLLEIIEIGFKGSHVGRHNAFIAWRALIDNFALDRALLLDSKRIKLLLMVLRIDNAKVEHVTIEKLNTWWHFCSCIGAKLSVNFEMIVHPLLQFCVGNGKLQCSSDLGLSPRLALKTSGNNTTMGAQSSTNVKYNLPVFPVVQKLGCQVIARLISKVGKSEDPGKISWAFDAFPDDLLGSSPVFVKHAPILMTALEKLLLNVGNIIEENLVLHIWISLGNHIKAAMDSTVKTECRDIFSAYLTTLHTVVKNQALPTQTILKMIQICCSFPQKVLASTAYNITGGQTVRACPAQLLCEVLLTSYVMESAGAQDSFIKLFTTLMNAGASNLQGALLFLQTVAEMLDSLAMSLTCPEGLWRMWSTLAQILKDTISTTNEVNQGDALEYNFGCMYSVLLLPIKHQLSSKISQTVNKTMLKTWKDLYHSFARLSALVATAEANSCFEEMCAKIIENWNPQLQDPLNLEFVSNISCKMLDCVDFSAVSVGQNQGGGLTLSPSKWVRRRQRPLGNLHSFVHLLASLQTELNLLLTKVDESGIGKKQDPTAPIVLFAQTQVEAHTKLFAHVTSTNVIYNCLAILSSPLARFYQPSTKPNAASAVKLFVISFWTKLEKLWQEITHCIISRYNGSFDSEFMGHMSPLLEATFLHNRRTIRSKTLALWNGTFGRNPALEYPSSLKLTLITVKEKHAIILPGLISNDDALVVAETPFSDMSMGESQVPAPISSLLASPKRQKGSLLNRDVSPVGKLSPKAKASPAKIVSPKHVRSLLTGIRTRIDLDSLPKETFVVIDSPATKKRRLLTEHQKEVLKQKCVLPAMYNSIDSSQDISLMSQFGTETQQSVSSADVIVVNSSQSQEHTNVALKGTKPLKDNRGNEFGAPLLRRSTSSSPRRSVRIQELQISDEFKCREIKARDPSTKFITEIDFNLSQTGPMSGNTDDLNRKMQSSVDEIDTSEQQKSDSLGKASQSCEAHTDTSHKCDGLTNIVVPVSDQKDADSPFLMFRTKQTGNKTSLSQSTKSPRRILLRKVRSQDDIPHSKLNQEMSTLSPDQKKMPRRVPLKKINEQVCEPNSDSFKESSENKSHGDSLTHTPTSKLGSWAALSEKQDNSQTEQPTNSTITFPGAEQVLESDSSIDVSCTLVEDTQSPFKVRQQQHSNKEIDHSIAETPHKGENSISPPVRAASARKLFVDCDTNVSQTPRADSEKATANKDDNKSEESSLIESSEITSSQGFETASDLVIQISSAQNIIESSHSEESGKEYTQVDKSASDLQTVTGSENDDLFPNTQGSNSPIDMMMSTLSSPLGHVQSSLNSSQCESHRTSSSDSNEALNKPSPTSDADFIWSQPTLTEEILIYTPNKRKKGTPKKFLQAKRGCKRHRKVTKGCHYCKKVSSHCHIKFGYISESKSAVDGNIVSISLSPSSQNSGTNTELSAIADGVLLPEAHIDSEDSVVFTKIKMSDKALQVIGEVTPDIKSPKSNPERRHSSVKRMRRPSERKVENSKVIKSSASKKIRMESTDSDKSNSDNKVDRKRSRGSGEGSKNKLKAMSQGDKGQPSPGKLSRSKHLLKTRSQAVCQQLPENQHSPPRKRSLKDLSSEDEDNLSLSSFVKKYKKDDSCIVSKVDDNNTDASNQIISDAQNAFSANEGSQNSDATDLENPDSNVTDQENPDSNATDLENPDSNATDLENPDSNVTDQENPDSNVTDKENPDSNVTDKENPDSNVTDKENPDSNVTDKENPDSNVTDRENPDSNVTDKENPDSNVTDKENPDSNVTDRENPDSNVTDKENSDSNASLHCSEAELLMIDAALNTALHRILLESSVTNANTNEHLTQNCVEVVATESSRSLEAPAMTNSPDISQDHMELGQSIIILSPENESQEPVTVDNMSVLEDSVSNDTAESVELLNVTCTSMPHLTAATSPQEYVSTGSSECTGEDSFVELEVPQLYSVVDKCLNSESVPAENEQAQPDGVGEQPDINKTCSSTLNPITEENVMECVTEAGHQHDKLGSPERNVIVVYDWSPTRSPSCGILKRCVETPPLGKNRRVSFAEPVVSGESPVREFYKEFVSTSPMISHHISSPGQKLSFNNKSQGKVSKYRRRLEPLKKQEPTRSPLARKIWSPQTQSSYKPTQESQLDNSGPVCPDLVDCTNPLDDILPQLTSSLWYRGLCQLMKGRNINTIGDLSALTEVQIDQLPIRHPKVETVKSTLNAYMAQHGLAKPVSSGETMQDGSKILQSKGSTIDQEVTPASIDDEGIEVHLSADKDLMHLSPITDSESELQKMQPVTLELDAGSSSHLADGAIGHSAPQDERSCQVLSGLKEVVKQYSASDLKKASMVELFDIHQTLNLLFTNVVEEMKSRHSNA